MEGGASLSSEPLKSLDLVGVLWFLLPGFVAMWVFAGLASYPKPSQLQRLVDALIFTAFAQAATIVVRALLVAIGRLHPIFGPWREGADEAWSVLLALLIGIVAAAIANHGFAHKLMNFLRVTRLTGFPSEWYGSFDALSPDHWVILHLRGERRLYGFVREWATGSKEGHILLSHVEWLGTPKTPGSNDENRILVPVKDVSFVEFVPMRGGINATQGSTAGPTTPAATPTGSTTTGDSVSGGTG